MPQHQVAVLHGDGIGPETMREALKVLETVQSLSGVTFELEDAPFGANAYFEHGHPFPDQTRSLCGRVQAVLKGPVGLSHEEAIRIPVELQPERGGVVPLRGHLQTFANLRPVFLPGEMAHVSPLKDRVIERGLDLVMVRELLGGLYTGEKRRGTTPEGRRYVEEALRYDEDQIRNVVRFAFRLAESRSGLLHNIHKRNILESSVLWNEIVEEEAPHFPAVHVHHMLVDAAATHLCLNPSQFDVMVMENLFGALTQGLVLDDELKRSIGRALRSQLSPHHVPDQIEQVPSVPRTLSGKKLEVPVKRILGGASPTAVASRSSLADQSSLDWFETYAAQAQASKSA